jgi:hypothetical protein
MTTQLTNVSNASNTSISSTPSETLKSDALNFEPYTEKSFAVRGSKLEDSKFREELVGKLTGPHIWNNKLKGGKGLIVTINDNNREVLTKYVSSETMPVNSAQSVHSVKPEEKEVKEENTGSKSSSSSDGSKKRRGRPRKEDKKRKEESDSEAYNSDSRNSISRSSSYASSSYDSDSYTSDYSDSDVPKRRGRKSTPSSYSPHRSRSRSRDESKESRPSRLVTPEKKSRKSSSESSAKEGKSANSVKSVKEGKSRKKYQTPNTESDLSDEERIQESIKHRSSNTGRKMVEMDGDINSDKEDNVTLSRRLRPMVKDIEMMKRILRKLAKKFEEK